jgi:hypothetical protein
MRLPCLSRVSSPRGRATGQSDLALVGVNDGADPPLVSATELVVRDTPDGTLSGCDAFRADARVRQCMVSDCAVWTSGLPAGLCPDFLANPQST